MVKYWPEIGKCGYLVWRYLLRRDDLEPAPWTPEGLERIKKLGLAVQVSPPVCLHVCDLQISPNAVILASGDICLHGNKRAVCLILMPFFPPVCPQYPPGYLAAMANKTKKEACARPGRGGRSKHYPGRGRPRRQRKIKEKEENDEEEEDMQPMASMEEEQEPQSNGEQKTTRDSGGCFHS